jgi:hypothetical protein
MRPAIRWLAALAAAGLVAPWPGSVQAQPAPDHQSWGKAGISFLQYRTDAVECAYLAGSTAPVSVPLVDQVFALDGQDVYEVIEQTKRSQYRTWNNVADQLEPALETCLRSRGYRPFKLTDEQNMQLKLLKRGSTSRHRYLYNLAIDPDVLKTQGL